MVEIGGGEKPTHAELDAGPGPGIEKVNSMPTSELEGTRSALPIEIAGAEIYSISYGGYSGAGSSGMVIFPYSTATDVGNGYDGTYSYPVYKELSG